MGLGMAPVQDDYCEPSSQPPSLEPCTGPPCHYIWITGEWSQVGTRAKMKTEIWFRSQCGLQYTHEIVEISLGGLKHVQWVSNSTSVPLNLGWKNTLLFLILLLCANMQVLVNVGVCFSMCDSVLCQLWCWLPATYCLMLHGTLPAVRSPVHCDPVLHCQHSLPWAPPSWYPAMPPQGLPSHNLLESWPMEQGETEIALSNHLIAIYRKHFDDLCIFHLCW